MADRYPEPLLDLDSLIERPKITIDAKPYELVSPEELSVIDTQRLASLGRRLDNLMKQDGEAQAKVLTDTLEQIVMAPVPVETRAKLSDGKKIAVVEVFTMLSQARKVQLAGATIPQIIKAMVANLPNQPTGEKPSPGSSGSTAATPSAG
jgi:hypothetical protein